MKKKSNRTPAVPLDRLLDKHLKSASKSELAVFLNSCLGENDDDGLEAFFSALEDVARAKGISELAADTKLARDTYYKAFAGKNPTLDTFRTMLNGLDLDIAIIDKRRA